jgi:hypothetical protein
VISSPGLMRFLLISMWFSRSQWQFGSLLWFALMKILSFGNIMASVVDFPVHQCVFRASSGILSKGVGFVFFAVLL